MLPTCAHETLKHTRKQEILSLLQFGRTGSKQIGREAACLLLLFSYFHWQCTSGNNIASTPVVCPHPTTFITDLSQPLIESKVAHNGQPANPPFWAVRIWMMGLGRRSGSRPGPEVARTKSTALRWLCFFSCSFRSVSLLCSATATSKIQPIHTSPPTPPNPHPTQHTTSK